MVYFMLMDSERVLLQMVQLLRYIYHMVNIVFPQKSNTSLNLTSKRSNADTLNIPMGAKKVIVTIKGKSDVVTALGGGAKLGIADVEVIR